MKSNIDVLINFDQNFAGVRAKLWHIKKKYRSLGSNVSIRACLIIQKKNYIYLGLISR